MDQTPEQLLLFWLRARGLEQEFSKLAEYGVESVEDLERFMDLEHSLSAGLELNAAFELQRCLTTENLHESPNYSVSPSHRIDAKAVQQAKAKKWLKSLPHALLLENDTSPYRLGAPRIRPGMFVVHHAESLENPCGCNFLSPFAHVTRASPPSRQATATGIPLCASAVPAQVVSVNLVHGIASVEVLAVAPEQVDTSDDNTAKDLILRRAGLEMAVSCEQLRPAVMLEDKALGLITVKHAPSITLRRAMLVPKAGRALRANLLSDTESIAFAKASLDRTLMQYSHLMLGKHSIVIKCTASVSLPKPGFEDATGALVKSDVPNGKSMSDDIKVEARSIKRAAAGTLLQQLRFSAGISAKVVSFQSTANEGEYDVDFSISFVGYGIRHADLHFNPLSTSVESFLRLLLSRMLSRPDDDSGQQAQLCHTFRQIAVDSVVPIPDVKDATIALSAAELPVGTVVVFFNLDHHPSFASNHFVNPKYLVGQIKGDIVTPHQMLYVVDVLQAVEDTVGFSFGRVYAPISARAVIPASEAIQIPNFKKDAFGRFHVKDDVDKLWQRALLHRPLRTDNH